MYDVTIDALCSRSTLFILIPFISCLKDLEIFSSNRRLGYFSIGDKHFPNNRVEFAQDINIDSTFRNLETSNIYNCFSFVT